METKKCQGSNMRFSRPLRLFVAISFVLRPIIFVKDVNMANSSISMYNLGSKYVSMFKDANIGNRSYNLANVGFEEWTSV
jgi:hypothetical protein